MRSRFLQTFAIAGVATAALSLIPSQASATLLATDTFSYATGNLVGKTNPGTSTSWNETGGNTSTTVQVAATSLSYPGLPASTGGRIAGLTGITGGEDPGLDLATAQTITDGAGQSFYYSVIANPTADFGTTTGDYFMHISPAGTATTAFYARLQFKQGASPGTFIVGISDRSEVTVFDTVSRPNGTPVFLVVKYSNVAGATNDTVNLFINPVPGSVEPAPSLTANTPTSSDATTFGRINIRQGAMSGNLDLDEIRFATTWAEVTPVGAAVSEWALY